MQTTCRRGTARKVVGWAAEFEVAGLGATPSRAYDVSLTGARIRSPHPVYEREEFKVVLKVGPSATVTAKAVCVRHQRVPAGHYILGVRFVRMSAADERLLRRMLSTEVASRSLASRMWQRFGRPNRREPAFALR